MTQLINQPSLEPYITITKGKKITCPFCSNPMEEVTQNSSMGWYERATCRCNHLHISSKAGDDGLVSELSMVLSVPGQIDIYFEFNYEYQIFLAEEPVTDTKLFECPLVAINPFDIPLILKKIKLYSTFS